MVFSTLATTVDIHGREHNKDVVSRIAFNVYAAGNDGPKALHIASLLDISSGPCLKRRVLLGYLLCTLRR